MKTKEHTPSHFRAEKTPSRKKQRKRIGLLVLLLAAIVCSGIWLILRSRAKTPDYADLRLSKTEIADSEAVIRAIALSYFVYGCENCSTLEGAISEMLDRHDMGILTENFGILRTDPDDPTTALFDASEFIRRSVGEARYLCSLKDARSGFFGAAFCDDVQRRIWIAYSGAIDFPDLTACAGLVLAPGFTAQEKAAFKLFDTVLQSDEIKKQAYEICLTGHSLGGALATTVSLASGCPAVTINGADGLAYGRFTQLSKKQPQECRIHNYMTSPEKGLSYMEIVQRLMFLGKKGGVTTHLLQKNGYTSDTHCAFSFVRFADDAYTKPIIPETDSGGTQWKPSGNNYTKLPKR